MAKEDFLNLFANFNKIIQPWISEADQDETIQILQRFISIFGPEIIWKRLSEFSVSDFEMSKS